MISSGEKTANRILERDLFLYLLDLEVKRARRYQNFLCLLLVKLRQLSGHDDGNSLEQFYQRLNLLLRDEIRESDIVGLLEENRLAILLPYADVSAGGYAKSRFEGTLSNYDFRSMGFDVAILQICFPMNGTDTADLVRKALGAEAS